MGREVKHSKYSDLDRKILLHFFTNLDKRVFIAKNMHPEIWAFLQAQYSRSKEGLRERFLKTLKKDEDTYGKLCLAAENDALDKIELIRAEEKAQLFLSKWGKKYGHGSIIEGAVVGIGIEDISIMEAKIIEDNRLSSFTEKSTRYVNFGHGRFSVPDEIIGSDYEQEYIDTIRYLIESYTRLNEMVLSHLKKKIPYDKTGDIKAWERAVRARCFDAIRYVLPAGMKTSLGWTVNARELEHAITKFLSHPWPEIRKLGREILEESEKILKVSLEFAEPNKYMISTNRIMPDIVNGFAKAHGVSEFENDIQSDVELVNISNDAENVLLSTIMYRYNERGMSYNECYKVIKDMRRKDKERLFDEFMKRLGPYDTPMRELEHVYLTFDIVIDFGAWRDLQRHRMCTQTKQRLTAKYGYSIPHDIIDTSYEAEQIYKNAMEKAGALSIKLSKHYPEASALIIPLGYKMRYLVTMNLRELYYEGKLRTSPQSHESYRNIVLKMCELAKQKMPLLMKYIKLNFDREALGRLKQEQQALS